MHKNQKGFAHIGILLIITVLAAAGGIGWYVWHNQTAKTDASSTNQTSEFITSAAKSKQFVFKELGVQITLPESLKQLNYVANEIEGTTYLGLLTPDFEEAIHNCDSSTKETTNLEFMSIAKITGQFNQDNNPGVGNLKQFRDFWISGSSPNGIVCDTSNQQYKDQFTRVFHNSIAAVKEAFKTATLSQ